CLLGSPSQSFLQAHSHHNPGGFGPLAERKGLTFRSVWDIPWHDADGYPSPPTPSCLFHLTQGFPSSSVISSANPGPQPKDNPMPDTKTITIQGHEVSIPVRYAEGHSLNANEANALNQLMLENIRNNVAGKIKKAADEAKVKPEEVNLDSATIGEGEDQTTLRQFIDNY